MNIKLRVVIARIYLCYWLARLSPCLARRWGLVGLMAATVHGGPRDGLPLGVALALAAKEKS